MNLVTSQGVGQAIGTVTIAETAKGLKFTPDLKALPPGAHGFHVHMNGSCQPAIKEGKPQPQNRLVAITIRIKPVNMMARKAQVIWATCRYWW